MSAYQGSGPAGAPLLASQIAGAGDARYVQLTLFKNYIDGYQMSTAGSSATLTVGAGIAMDSTNVSLISLPSGNIAKTTSSWAAGTGVGGLDTGTIANNTWYHWFVILNPISGAMDVVFSATSTPNSGPSLLPS